MIDAANDAGGVPAVSTAGFVPGAGGSGGFGSRRVYPPAGGDQSALAPAVADFSLERTMGAMRWKERPPERPSTASKKAIVDLEQAFKLRHGEEGPATLRAQSHRRAGQDRARKSQTLEFPAGFEPASRCSSRAGSQRTGGGSTLGGEGGA